MRRCGHGCEMLQSLEIDCTVVYGFPFTKIENKKYYYLTHQLLASKWYSGRYPGNSVEWT